MKLGDVIQLGRARYTVVGVDPDDLGFNLMGPGAKSHESRLRYIDTAGMWHHGRYLSRGGKKSWYRRDGDRFELVS